MDLWTFDAAAERRWREWFSYNRNVVVYPLICVYLTGIYLAQRQMRNRKAYDLKTPLFLWNSFLAVFSICGAVNTLPEMIGLFQFNNALYTSACLNDHWSESFRYWRLLFVLTKALEFGDTVFIVLRKRPLIFLHWYHHISIFWTCWIFYHTYGSISAWFCALNYTVHSVMYSYYAVRALKIRVAPVISQGITSMQIIQMVLGLATCLFAIVTKLSGQYCETDWTFALASTFVSSSYFVLFTQFFRATYLKNTTKQTN